jgi:Zn finger protein HypA/HybF involved in hydrogenase expression
MTTRAFRCRECGYPFKTAAEGWERHAALMCPACGGADVSILDPAARWEVVTMAAAGQQAGTVTGREEPSTAA